MHTRCFTGNTKGKMEEKKPRKLSGGGFNDIFHLSNLPNEPLNLSKEDALLSGCDDYIALNQTNQAIILTLSLYTNSEVLT